MLRMKCKKIFDGRTLNRRAKEQLRISAVKRIENGESPEFVAKGLGINRRTIYKWLERYHYGGTDALKNKPIPGAPPKINAKQMQKLAKIIRDKDPIQLKFDFALWTLSMIRILIVKLFNVRVSEVSVGRIMKRLGFSPQRPLYRAWQQNPVLVSKWREIEYPKIVERAKREKALIFFEDESGVRSDYHAGTTWAPIGKTPIVKSTGSRYSMNILSAVNSLGHFRFMMVNGSVNAKVFREFLKRLITGVENKIFLIADGHPAHKAKIIKKYLEDNKDKIELFILPPYSPELNPDELVWANLKAKVSKRVSKTKEELKKNILSILKQIQKLTNLVSSFFHTPSCSYTIS